MKYFLASLTKAEGSFFQILVCGHLQPLCVFSGTCNFWLAPKGWVCIMVDQTGSVYLSELVVMLNNRNNSSPGTTYVTSQSAASGVCI